VTPARRAMLRHVLLSNNVGRFPRLAEGRDRRALLADGLVRRERGGWEITADGRRELGDVQGA